MINEFHFVNIYFVIFINFILYTLHHKIYCDGLSRSLELPKVMKIWFLNDLMLLLMGAEITYYLLLLTKWLIIVIFLKLGTCVHNNLVYKDVSSPGTLKELHF
jgi:hypothetical protein